MAIKKTATGWQVDFRSDGRGSKRHRKSFPTKGEARRWERMIRERVRKDPTWQPAATERRQLNDLIQTWYDHHGVHLRSDQYRRLAALADHLGNPLAREVSGGMFASYRRKRLEAGITPKTLNIEHGYLRAMFNELIRLGLWDQENPLAGLRQLRIPERELSYLDVDEIRLLLEAVDKSTSPSLRYVVRLCLATGARWGEAEGLKVSEIGAGIVQFTRTKTGRNRAVPVQPKLLEAIREQAPKRGRVFKGCYGAFQSTVARCGLELPKGQLTHILRHTFASHFIMKGGNILVLQRILGHQSLNMTMRYAHLAPDHLKEALELNPLEIVEKRGHFVDTKRNAQ